MEYLRDNKTWKTGIVDLRWDEARGVWTSHDIIRGQVKEIINYGNSGTVMDLDREGVSYLVYNQLVASLSPGLEVLIGYTGIPNTSQSSDDKAIYRIISTRYNITNSSTDFGVVVARDSTTGGMSETWSIKLNGTTLGSYDTTNATCSGFLARTNSSIPLSVFESNSSYCTGGYSPTSFSRNLINPSGANNVLEIVHISTNPATGFLQDSIGLAQVFGLSKDIRETDTNGWVINETLFQDTFNDEVGSGYTFNFPGPYP